MTKKERNDWLKLVNPSIKKMDFRPKLKNSKRKFDELVKELFNPNDFAGCDAYDKAREKIIIESHER